MALDSANVLVALTGAALVAPLGTTAPTDTTAAWDGAFVDLGYLSEEGITETPTDETTDIVAWQMGATVRSLITSSTLTFGFTMIETTKRGIELHSGGTVTGTHATGRGPASLSISGPNNTRMAFGFDVVDGDDDIRIVVPNASVTERGEITYVSNDAIGYPVTITANAGPGGVTAVKYFSNLAGLPES